MLRGIGEYTFWRPIHGRAVVVFFVTMAVEGIVFRRLGMHFDFVPGVLAYLGLPALAAWGATLAPLHGKRLDRWLADRLAYQFGSKRFDRGRAAPEPGNYRIRGDKQ